MSGRGNPGAGPGYRTTSRRLATVKLPADGKRYAPEGLNFSGGGRAAGGRVRLGVQARYRERWGGQVNGDPGDLDGSGAGS